MPKIAYFDDNYEQAVIERGLIFNVLNTLLYG